MDEEQSLPRIRPVWLIGGGMALAILGICALLSVVAAVGIVWYTIETESRARQATQIAYDYQTAQASRKTQVAAPPLPAATCAAPIATQPAAFPTAINASPVSLTRPAPDQAVKTYYQWVSQSRYDLTWPLLTERFKQKFNCCAPNYDYSGYVSWWDSVNYVEFGKVMIVSQQSDLAVVYAEVYYIMNAGTRFLDKEPYFRLVYDPAGGNWRFDDKGSTPWCKLV
jgi:serine/threonine-protein kinase